MTANPVSSTLALFFIWGTLHAAPLQQNAEGRGEIEPLERLPGHLQAPEDELSLLADFAAKKDGRVMVYLVNNTAIPALLASQDGDLGCKREVKAADGRWHRCDSHAYSWCGNSYLSFDLPAGHFVSWSQACDAKTGESRPLRFKLYNQQLENVVSNEGTGVVDEADVQFCRYDSLAMRHGPFEDVAAVAMGKVTGGQGASIDGMSDAIRALERFPNEKRLFAVVREVVNRLVRERGRDATDRRYSHSYTSCLASLQKAMERSVSRDMVWDYVESHVNDSKFPWQAEALGWLSRVFEWDREKFAEMLDKVLFTPGHPATWVAANALFKVTTKVDAGKRLASIENDEARPARDRHAARHARETLFANPYLAIKTEAGEPLGNDGDAAPLKRVTFTNHSPRQLTLPVAAAASLLVVEITGGSEDGEPFFARLPGEPEAGTLVIEPGESVSAHDVRWWDRIDPKHINPNGYYSVSFLAQTPGVWEVPARPNWSWGFKGEKILKAIATTTAR